MDAIYVVHVHLSPSIYNLSELVGFTQPVFYKILQLSFVIIFF